MDRFSKDRRVRVTAKVGLAKAPIRRIQAAFEIAAPVIKIEDPNWHRAREARTTVRMEAGRVGGVGIERNGE